MSTPLAGQDEGATPISERPTIHAGEASLEEAARAIDHADLANA